jgi:CelD/BcsL family acetyltransferase involved in cellulose biosynthesis
MTATAALAVDVSRDATCFDLPEWRDLLRRDPDRHIFATPEWSRLWWEEFHTGKELIVLTMRRDDDVVAIVPLYRKLEDERRVLRFVGGIDLTDYLGPVCAPDDRDVVARTLVSWLASTDLAWDELDAHNMPVPFGFAEVLVDHADRKGYGFALDQEETSAVLPLVGDWDGYVARLGSKERHELRRKMRRLGREHPDATVRAATESTLERDLETFFHMHRGAEGHKGHFMRPEIATFFRRLAHAFVPLGWLRLDLLEIGERAIAATFGFQVENRFYLYNSAFEPDASRLSPGFVLVAELVKRAIGEGIELFDFLRGPERYKYQLGAQAVPLHNVRIRNEGP